MNPRRKKRLGIVLAIFIGISATIGLMLYALNQNMDLFYTPTELVNGKPDGTKPEVGQRLRIGGMVVVGSVRRDPESLKVSFDLHDVGPKVTIVYEGILPDLFREGQGIVAQGVLEDATTVKAFEVLAKHDEEYMPPEIAEAMKKTHEPLQYTSEQKQGSAMIAEIGHFALILSLAMALLLSILPLWGASNNNTMLMNTARPLSWSMFVMLFFSFAILCWGFYTNDFTLQYVASNSNSQLPWYYRLTAVWGAHEGSLLLWVLIQAAWTVAVATFSRGMPQESVARVLAVMGMISVGFLLFIILTSNPFLRTLPFFPVDGRDLNPLLQDPGLIVHPPMLYMGYVGFSVAFSFAIASLMTGRLDTAWARWSRPWTTAAWVFLTLGIALGSWWAYYELGWGGWWFWDPVENASFMPWLAGTALMHSLAVTEKRGTFKAWTVLLAISAFSLSLLGTFLVRSGILVSVHAFASDPSRGMFILGFLVFVIGGSLLLFAVKGAAVRVRGNFDLVSRENALLANNVLLIAALVVVLVGTLLPLVHKQIGLGSVSIGAPFFDMLFAWLMMPFAFLLGIGPMIRWKRDNLSKLIKPMIVSGVLAFALGAVCVFLFADFFSAMAYIGWVMAIWIIAMHGFELYERATHRHSFGEGVRKLQRSHWAMMLGHIGLAVTVIGIAMVQNYSIERDVRLAPGEHFKIYGYDFYFSGLRDKDGPNYDGYIADFEITNDGKYVNTLHAEKRFYRTAKSMMTEAAIDRGITRDLYIAMGERLEDNRSWAVRIYYKPFVRWIWAGSLIMSLGGALAISDRRYRFRKTAKKGDKSKLAEQEAK